MLTRLCVSSHPAAAWAEVVEPWLRAHGDHWRDKRAVLAPNATWLAALKAGAVNANLPVLGIEWCTPGRWRTQALNVLPGAKPHVALREDLHLLLELAAESLPANPLARAYGADPALFQELLDTLESAGWDGAVLSDRHARELAQASAKLRAHTGWLTAAAADRILRESAMAGTLPRVGKNLLIVGFGPGDWAQAALLEAAVAGYDECEIILDAADNAVERDSTSTAWIGRWEELFGDAAVWLEAPVEISAPFGLLALTMSDPALAAKNAGKNTAPLFWLAENLQTEADLVAAQALAFLRENENARVGVVVGSLASPLAREVATRFTALGCPHHDATGHLPGRERAQALFEAWLDWQEDGRLAGLVLWVRAAGHHGLLGEKSVRAVEKALHHAAQNLLTDDPAVLASWVHDGHGEAMEARDFLTEWPRLPETATWDDYLPKILAVSTKLHWPDEPEVLTERAAGWHAKLPAALPRAALLRWVRAVTRVPGRTRAVLGREPWARLQIVDAAGAPAQTWTHLILGGLQHGEWPADRSDSPLLDDACREKLNQQVLRQGPHGEGHWTTAPGRGLLLTASDFRRLDRANFARLLALPTRGLALTARETDPLDGRRARLSEYYWAATRAALGRLPAEADWRSLAQATRERHASLGDIFRGSSTNHFRKEILSAPGPEQTARAYLARRDDNSAFDEYSFCLRNQPATPLTMSSKQWDEAARQPGAAWFKYLLKAKPRWHPAEDDDTRLSLGLWSHAWTRPGPENAVESYPLPKGKTWQKFSTDAAEQLYQKARTAFAAAGRPVPQSWLEVQAAAARLAAQWIAVLAELSDWPHALAEISLPNNLTISLPERAEKIPLTGRMDLVLFPRPVLFAPGKLNATPAWLFDFKTGGDDQLTKKRLSKGEGLQLALYARALLALGASTVELTLLNASATAEAQLTDADLAAPELAQRWRLLVDFAVRGHWGEFSDLEDEHARPGDYPSATLPVPVEILERKWQLTHEVSR